MNANATVGTNDANNANNMNTTGFYTAGNDLLQVISGGRLPSLEVTASGDAFPTLKAAIVEALAIVAIVKVCFYFSHSVMSIYATSSEIQDQQERLGHFF